MEEKLTLTDSQVQIWREVMTQLRHLSDDVFKSVALFTGINLVILCGEFAAMTGACRIHRLIWVCIVIALCGITVTLAARFMLKRHRIYYLEMLVKKSLLEKELGLYERRLAGSAVDWALPWRLKPEVVTEIGKDFEGWIQKSIRSKGTMAKVYFLMYETVIALHTMCVAIALSALFQK